MDLLGVPPPRLARAHSRLGGSALKPLDPRLLRAASATRMLLLAATAVAVVHTLAIVAFTWFAASTIAAVIAGEPWSALGGPVIATAVSILVRAAAQAAIDGLALRGALRVKAQLRTAALEAIDRGGSPLLARHSSARLAVLLGKGLDAMDGYVGQYLPQLVLTVVATPILVGVLVLADLTTGIAVILTLPLIPIFMVLIGLATQAVQQRQWQALGSLAQGFSEVVEGLSTLIIFGRQHRQEQRIRAVTDEYRRRTMAVLRLSFLSGFALELAASLSVAVVAVSIGVRLIDGDIALALGLFVLMLVPEAYLPLRQVGAKYHAAAEGLAAASDVLTIVDEPSLSRPQVPSTPAGETPPSDTAAPLSVRSLVVERDRGRVIDGLDLDVAAGELVALTGPSGSGKSTLLAAILEFAAISDGHILVGGNAHARRQRLAWAGQRPGLVGKTLADAIALGDPDPDAALIERARGAAALDDLDAVTPLDVQGGGVSGGQAQRIAIARAVYRAGRLDAPLLLLDEPTSALDSETEARVLVGLREFADAGRGVLVVTHRAAVAAAADRVVTLAGPALLAAPETAAART